jgi:hypothetical protein
MKTTTFLAAIIACAAFAIDAQEIADKQSDARQENTAGGQARAYSQPENISQDLPLDLLALNNPEALHERAVIDSSGDEIGSVVEITRNRSDQALYAVVDLSTGVRAALPLEDLSLAALAYYDPAQSLADQLYVPAEFEQVSQYQAGHSAWGSLANSTVESTARRPPREDPDLATEPVGLPQQPTLEQQTQVAAAQPQTPAQTSTSGSAAGTAYIASGSPLVQLALTNPDALQLKPLLDETGKPLGEISHIAKNIANQELYAVINMNTQHGQTAVKLDALSIAQLAYLGDTGKLLREDFDEEEFVPITGQ